jgi:predicted nucleotidyltransferase
METTKNVLPENVKKFFNNLTDVLDTKLLFFGSVQRADYFPGKSDIDVAVFSDNVKSTIYKLQYYLHLNKEEFRRFIWRLNDHKRTLVNGYKVMYKSADGNFASEFSVYNQKYKHLILEEHIKKTDLPFYVTCILILVKILFYKMNVISEKTFGYLKKKIMSVVIGLPDDEFLVIDSKHFPKRKYNHNSYDIF